MLTVFAKIDVKPDFFKKARQAIVDILPDTRKEKGCLLFELHEGLEGASLYLYEEWQDESALEFHYQQTYTKQVFAAYEEWLSCPPHITKMRKVC